MQSLLDATLDILAPVDSIEAEAEAKEIAEAEYMAMLELKAEGYSVTINAN